MIHISRINVDHLDQAANEKLGALTGFIESNVADAVKGIVMPDSDSS